MAENEQLDATHSRKWLPVARAIGAGAKPPIVAFEIEKTLCKRLRRLSADGLLPEMIRSLDNPQDMHRLCREWEGHPAVAYAFLDAADQSGLAEDRLQYALGQFLDIALADVPVLAIENSGAPSITAARDVLDSAREQHDHGFLANLAKKLAANPDWSARARSPETPSTVDFASTESMLSESLLQRS